MSDVMRPAPPDTLASDGVGLQAPSPRQRAVPGPIALGREAPRDAIGTHTLNGETRERHDEGKG